MPNNTPIHQPLMQGTLKSKANDILHEDKGKAQFIRFVLNGIFSAAVHYGIYFLCQMFLEVNLSYSIGYIISYLINFYTTTIFTFRAQPTWKKFIGFSGSHGVNYGLHVVLFWCCMQLSINRFIAPIIVMGIAMLVQFTILRLIFKKH